MRKQRVKLANKVITQLVRCRDYIYTQVAQF